MGLGVKQNQVQVLILLHISFVTLGKLFNLSEL